MDRIPTLRKQFKDNKIKPKKKKKSGSSSSYDPEYDRMRRDAKRIAQGLPTVDESRAEKIITALNFLKELIKGKTRQEASDAVGIKLSSACSYMQRANKALDVDMTIAMFKLNSSKWLKEIDDKQTEIIEKYLL